jgi:small subunit ribosomal protein S17
MEQEQDKRGKRRVLQGVVTSDKMEKTITVKVIRFFQHPLYKKYVHRSKKYKAHDEKNECHTGDMVRIVECRPLARDKRWRLHQIVDRAEI